MFAGIVWRGIGAASVVSVVLAGFAVTPARAQSSSSIVGTVRDESGGALLGVTVEVTSPALIERIEDRRSPATTAAIASSTCVRANTR